MQRRCQSPRDSLWGEPLIPPPAWHSATQSGLWRGLWEIGENDPSLYLTVLFCEDLVHTITNCVKQTNKKARKEVMRGFISVFLRYSLMALNFTHFPDRLWFLVSLAAGVCAHPTAGGGCEVRLGMWWPQCPCVSLSPSPGTHGAPAAVEVKVWCDVMSQAW